MSCQFFFVWSWICFRAFVSVRPDWPIKMDHSLNQPESQTGQTEADRSRHKQIKEKSEAFCSLKRRFPGFQPDLKTGSQRSSQQEDRNRVPIERAAGCLMLNRLKPTADKQSDYILAFQQGKLFLFLK
ncbi:hypothetical protein AAK899_09365 [Erysipelotrichaceae bacterium 51-3]